MVFTAASFTATLRVLASTCSATHRASACLSTCSRWIRWVSFLVTTRWTNPRPDLDCLAFLCASASYRLAASCFNSSSAGRRAYACLAATRTACSVSMSVLDVAFLSAFVLARSAACCTSSHSAAHFLFLPFCFCVEVSPDICPRCWSHLPIFR